MFLVDSRFDSRNESRHHLALDRAVSSVLSADLPEREKQLQYEQALHRYRTNLTNIEAAANKPVKVQPTAGEKSVKDKIIETVAAEDTARALQVYDDLSAYASLTVDKQGRLIQDGTVIADSNLIDLIAHDVKKKKRTKTALCLGNIFYCKEASQHQERTVVIESWRKK